MLKVKKITAQQTYPIRLQVLRNNIDLPYEFVEDVFDNTIHLGVFNNEMLVGVATLIKKKLNALKGEQYQLRGMATLPEARGIGAGRLLLKEAIIILKADGINVLWCNARKEAVGFYKSLGFKIKGTEFEVPKVGAHFKMYYIVS